MTNITEQQHQYYFFIAEFSDWRREGGEGLIDVVVNRMWCKTEKEVCRFNTVRVGYSTRSYKMYKTPSSNYKQHTSEGKKTSHVSNGYRRLEKPSVLTVPYAISVPFQAELSWREPLETRCVLSPRWTKQIYQECFYLLGIRSHVACVFVIVSGSAVETQTWPGAAPLVMWPPSSMPSGSEKGCGREGGENGGARIEREKKEKGKEGKGVKMKKRKSLSAESGVLSVGGGVQNVMPVCSLEHVSLL